VFAESLLRGDYRAAAGAEGVHPAPTWEEEATRAGLLYLAGRKANDAAFADGQWPKLVAALDRGDREARRLSAIAAGRQPVDVARATAAAVEPGLKRVVLAALARRSPGHAAELDALAKKLDFERDAVSLCLRFVTE
jgi:hypothetical protein